MCVGGCRFGVQGIQYYKNIIIIFGGFNVNNFADLVQRSVLTLDGEIWRYRNDRYHYHYLPALLTAAVASRQ